MRELVRTFIADDRGQDLAEYGIALAVIATFVVLVVAQIATDVNGLWTVASDQMNTVVAGLGN
jgi:Flp pilus assembly pilin Flp